MAHQYGIGRYQYQSKCDNSNCLDLRIRSTMITEATLNGTTQRTMQESNIHLTHKIDRQQNNDRHLIEIYISMEVRGIERGGQKNETELTQLK